MEQAVAIPVKRDRKQYQKKRYQEKREYLLAQSATYYENNKETVGEKRLAYRQAYRLRVIEHLGGKCKDCGFTDIRALQIDHVDGGGIKDRAGLMYGFWKKVLSDTSGKYQLLCANCNAIKRIVNKEHRK
jgi:hypothetical protein